MNSDNSHQKKSFKRYSMLFLLFILIVAIAVGLFIFIRYDHGCDWSGLGECKFVNNPNEIVRPAKTLWDWLELLIVPLVLASSGYIVNRAVQRGERVRSENNAILERQIAEDSLREAALQSYLDKMADLLLERGLRSSSEPDEVRAVARSKTLTVLRRLDGSRRAVLLRFLKETNLIDTTDSVVDLQGAQLDNSVLELVDLQGVNLEGVSLKESILAQSLLSSSNLTDADLSKSNLSNADLRQSLMFRANLSNSDLTHADLRGGDMRFANLRGAILRGANLEAANFNQADISYADFTDSNITDEQIEMCRSTLEVVTSNRK